MTEALRTSNKTKEAVLASIREFALIPVIRVASREQAMCAVRGIIGAGITIAEVTLTIPGALGIIEELTDTHGENLLVGAGTVLDAASCEAAVQAGAEFIVSPVFGAKVGDIAKKHGKLFMPGALTPSEVFAAWQAGADVVKVFPCGNVGGPTYVRELKGPFPQIDVVVTGGVTLGNCEEFLAMGATAVGVGELIFEPEALKAGNDEAISANARRFVEAVRKFKRK